MDLIKKHLLESAINLRKTLSEQANALQKLAEIEEEIIKKRDRRWQTRPYFAARPVKGWYHTGFKDAWQDPDMFRLYFHMERETFLYILKTIKSRIEKQGPRAISPPERLAVTLKYIIDGSSFNALSGYFRIADNTIGVIIKETLTAIWTTLVRKHMPVPTKEQLTQAAEEFYIKTEFPHVVMCLDGKHFSIVNPDERCNQFYNRKGFFSINVQAAVDARYRFVSIESGAYGSQHDASVFASSSLRRLIESTEIDLATKSPLPGSTLEAPLVILADKGYGLSDYILKPYTASVLSEDENRFNKKLASVRRIVENSFALLVNEFRIFTRPMDASIECCDLIILASSLIHNIIIDIEKRHCEVLPYELDAQATVATSPAANILTIRDIFKEYFASTKITKRFH